MVVAFINTYAINAYHHLRCEFELHLCEVYLIQQYVIKFVSDLWQGQWFSLGTPVPSTNKTACHNITEILLKVALNIKTPNPTRADTILPVISETTYIM